MGLVLAARAPAAERRSWTKIYYAGGTVAIKTSPYDYNTKLAISANPDAVVLTIAPAKVFAPEAILRIDPRRIISVTAGSAALRRVAEVPGARVPARTPSLFGYMQDNAYAGIVWKSDSGKSEAVLLETIYAWQFLPALAKLANKEVDAGR